MTTTTYEATRRTFSEAPTVPTVADTATIETVADTATIETVADTATPSGRRRFASPVLAMAAGLVVLAAAGALTVLPSRARPGRTASPAAVTAPAADPQAITLSERDVSVVTQVHEPGHDDGWHTHPGIHAVAVLSGALTVYDADCRVTTYGPGQPHVGGRGLHLVRNESSVPVVMSVAYLSPTAPGSPTQRLAAPAGCVVPT